jgi:hypothetical protein
VQPASVTKINSIDRLFWRQQVPGSATFEAAVSIEGTLMLGAWPSSSAQIVEGGSKWRRRASGREALVQQAVGRCRRNWPIANERHDLLGWPRVDDARIHDRFGVESP